MFQNVLRFFCRIASQHPILVEKYRSLLASYPLFVWKYWDIFEAYPILVEKYRGLVTSEPLFVDLFWEKNIP